MAHSLLPNYGLYRKMEMHRLHEANAEEVTKYHSGGHIKSLHSIHPDACGVQQADAEIPRW